MGDRRMASIFPECDQLKQVASLSCRDVTPLQGQNCSKSMFLKNYDKCFTEFFQKFIAPNYRHKYAINPCDRLHQAYRECVEQKLATDRPFEIDLSEVQKEFLNTEGDKLRDTQEGK